MKKNVLALSIATMIGGLGFSGAAMAQATFDVNESGTGAIQIVPYFTVQDGNATVLHVVNTDEQNGKAVKVRFRGASNSDDLLDFQVFLSPGDVWTGMASADAEGRLQLVTNDNSCTLPASVRTDGVTKAPVDRLTNRLWDTEAKQFAQTREGYIEILEMATIPEDDANGKNALFTAVKHVKKDGKMQAPCTAAAFEFLDSIADGGATEAANDARITAPTNALSASWYIMNVANSTTFSGSATALVAQGALIPVYAAQKAAQASNLVTADPLMAAATPVVEKQDFDVPDLSTPLAGDATNAAQASTQAGHLSAAINRAKVTNQFYHDAHLSAATDWVFSMPTRRYLVAANYAAEKYTGGEAGVFNAVNVGASTDGTGTSASYVYRNADATAIAAGAATGNKFNLAKNISVNAQGQICVTAAGQKFFDREEDSVTDGHVVSPGTAKKLQLCGEVHVTTFGAKSPLGASIATSNISTGFGEGWGYVNFGTGADNGVPVLGAAFTSASNPNAAAGMVGNYGITLPHFYK